jgi:hypothetical protein
MSSVSAMRLTSGRLAGLAALAALAIAGCGGGSDGPALGGSSSSGGSSSGGSSSGGSSSGGLSNVAPVVVDAGPAALTSGSTNVLFVSVTICVPGTSNCQTIDHVNVDTASVGLRILASAMPQSMSLPQVSSAGALVAECIQFADGYSWGGLRSADVQIGGERAANLTIHVIGDSGVPAQAPTDCVNSGPSQTAENTVATFGANGILGIEGFLQDCGSACVSSVIPGSYYLCTGGNCQGTTMPLAQQVQQPVSQFATDNNGVIVQLPAIGGAGAVSVTGQLVFGIDTQSNNALGSAFVLGLDGLGNFITYLNSQKLNESFIDSGSNGYFFNDSLNGALVNCTMATGFYCPTTTQNLSAMNQSASGTGPTSTVQFSVANAENVFNANPSFSAFNDLGGSQPAGFTSSFDWGMPFFYGRNVFVAIENATTSGGVGPFYAY